MANTLPFSNMLTGQITALFSGKKVKCKVRTWDKFCFSFKNLIKVVFLSRNLGCVQVKC